jgi:polyphenol oxidase
MHRKQQDGVHWLEFELLADFPDLKHAIFLRHGGMSEENYHSLNFSSWAGDDPKKVAANIAKIKRIFKLDSLIIPSLRHGNQVVSVVKESVDQAHSCDALCTNQRDLGLLVTHADCQAAIFYDPIQKAVANVHAGWRGNVQNIYAETVKFMQQRYKSQPADLLVGISPSLGPKAAQFIHYRTELPETFWVFEEQKNYFNLWEISKMQLLESGILPQHIEIAEMCTYSTPEDFFSYRREKQSGRHGTLAFLV